MANKPTPEELKNGLSEMQFYVTQHHGTEPPFTGRLLHNKKNGVYHCLVCDAPLPVLMAFIWIKSLVSRQMLFTN